MEVCYKMIIRIVVFIGLILLNHTVALGHNSGYVKSSSGAFVKSTEGHCVGFGDINDLQNCHDARAKQVTIDDVASSIDIPSIDNPADHAPKPIKVKESLSFSGDALFNTDSAELTPKGKQSLNKLIDIIKFTDSLVIERIIIVGHADSRGPLSYNQILSEERAKTVAYYLGANGIDFDLMSITGVGETQPIASNNTQEGMALNRRVGLEINGSVTINR